MGRARHPATKARHQRYESTYVFGAVCPARDTGVALILPYANTAAMQRHLDEIAKHVAPGSHALMLLDNAGRHRTAKLKWPANLSPVFIPPACPELNAAEIIWQYLRQTYLSNRVFATYTAIVDAACNAWNRPIAEAGRIASIATRKWVLAVNDYAAWYQMCALEAGAAQHVVRSSCSCKSSWLHALAAIYIGLAGVPIYSVNKSATYANLLASPTGCQAPCSRSIELVFNPQAPRS